MGRGFGDALGTAGDRPGELMISLDIELALVGIAAMLEPATLISSTLALLVGDRPLRTGLWFLAGGLGLTMVVGLVGAFALGALAYAPESSPKTWVSIVSLLLGCALAGYAVVVATRRRDGDQGTAIVSRMRSVSRASGWTILLAGAVLANAGIFMVVALKSISQLDVSGVSYLLDWTLFAVVSLLPLVVSLAMLVIAPGWAMPRLTIARGWIEAHARDITAVICGLLAISLIYEGVAGLTA
jgi:hypothetical protein